MKKLLLLAMMIGLLVIQTAWAEDCDRCGSQLVCVGDTKFAFMAKCGEPDYVERFGKFNWYWSEKLYYNSGNGSFIRVYTFQGGKLTNIELGERGWSK